MSEKVALKIYLRVGGIVYLENGDTISVKKLGDLNFTEGTIAALDHDKVLLRNKDNKETVLGLKEISYLRYDGNDYYKFEIEIKLGLACGSVIVHSGEHCWFHLTKDSVKDIYRGDVLVKKISRSGTIVVVIKEKNFEVNIADIKELRYF
ncbi:hypothetical protein LQZ18_10390 [Lachnospiraceae bacterium ZAX-1]